MAWNAQPSGGWLPSDPLAQENMDEIYNMLYPEWTLTAICGMLGNMGDESGYNPWRWQGDRVGNNRGYGLVQYTPAVTHYDDQGRKRVGYINGTGTGMEGFGSSYTGYAPNMSTSSVTGNISDAHAQVLAINANAGGKYAKRSGKYDCPYEDLSSVSTYAQYKQCNDLWIATLGWLFYYEQPADKSYSVAQSRFAKAVECWNHFTQDPPVPPTPPPPSPQKGQKPLYLYCCRKFREKRGLIT